MLAEQLNRSVFYSVQSYVMHRWNLINSMYMYVLHN